MGMGLLGLCFGQRGSDELTGWRPHVQGPRPKGRLAVHLLRLVRYSNLDNGNDDCMRWRYSTPKGVPCMEAAPWRPETRTGQAASSLIEATLHPKRYKRNYRAGPDRLEQARGTKQRARGAPSRPVAEIGTWSGPPEQTQPQSVAATS